MKQIHKKNLYLINPEVLLEILCHWREYKPLFIVHIIVELQRRNFYAPPIKDQATLLQIINDICQDHFVDNVNDLIQLYDVQSFPTLYLLDKDKRIVAKKLSFEQIDEILQLKLKEKK